MAETAIEWATHVWNPVTGCDRVSPGCAHCYALELAPRLRKMQIARGGGRWASAPDGGRTSGPAFGVAIHQDCRLVGTEADDWVLNVEREALLRALEVLAQERKAVPADA